MALGYFTLASAASRRSRYATIDGQRYEVQVDNFVDRPTSDPTRHASSSPTASGCRSRAMRTARSRCSHRRQRRAQALAKGAVRGRRRARSAASSRCMLLALSLVSVGNGFFKPNISTIVGSLYDQGDRRRDAGFTIFYMGINLGSLLGAVLLPVPRRLVRLVGGLRPRRASACCQLDPDPVRRRPARRLWRAARAHGAEQTRLDHLYRRAAARSRSSGSCSAT